MKSKPCPFCTGEHDDPSDDGCCFCDHTGRVYISDVPALSESCQHSCGPSDFYEGGKCYKMGCYEKDESSHVDTITLEDTLNRFMDFCRKIDNVWAEEFRAMIKDYVESISKTQAAHTSS